MRLDIKGWDDEDRGAAPAPATVDRTVEDARLVAACLTPGLAPSTADRAAASLLRRFGCLSGVLGATAEALADAPAMTRAAADDLLRMKAIAVRLAQAEVGPRSVIASWTALLAYIGASLRHERREQFRVLFLDVRNCLIRDEVLGVGTLDHAPVYPREVVRRALELCASAVILVHNHPGGDPTPSRADIDMTRQVIEAGRLLKVTVHDHLIVGRDSVASFKSLGLI